MPPFLRSIGKMELKINELQKAQNRLVK